LAQVLSDQSPTSRFAAHFVKGRMGPPKSRYGRRDIPLDPLFATALHEHHAATEWPDDEDPVFPAANRSPLMPNNVFRQ
jgi:hypothetical protein